MWELINFCFKGGNKDSLGLLGIWTNSRQKYRFSINKALLKLAFNYLLDNCYLTLGSMCFRQLIGIPMWFDHSPCMTNSFLY